ncbi:MAG: DUF3240 family protein [Gammaproteobacteria bacterium]|nr:DUF3240 family protein [Gammaproteobacteria bacterium]
MSDCMLELIASSGTEARVLELLLADERVPGFHSTTIFGHGSVFDELETAEQVAGRQRQTLFRVRLEETQARALIETLRVALRGSHVRYVLLPIIDSGLLE